MTCIILGFHDRLTLSFKNWFSLLGAMFPLPRIIYAMASDGLLFRFMGKVHPKFKTPFIGTLLAGLFTGTLACIFELEQLFTMMSIGTLLAYSMVAACVLILRYDNGDESETITQELTFANYARQLFNKEQKIPTNLTKRLVIWLVFFYGKCIFSVVSCRTFWLVFFYGKYIYIY